MSEKNQSDSTLRRTFMKGAAATGVAATGLGAFSGSAAAQQNVRNLNVRDVQAAGDSLLQVQVQNPNMLNNIDVDIDDVVVTVIGGDVRDVVTVNVEDITFEDRVINVELENVLQDITVQNFLNNNVVQVIVTALSDGDVVATGDIVDN